MGHGAAGPGAVSAARQMHLALMMQLAVHHGAWRHPDAHPEEAQDFAFYARLARKAEQARFDFIFWADVLCAYIGDTVFPGEPERQARNLDALMHQEPQRLLEPFTLLSALSVVTEHLGLVMTGNTTYTEPYHLARMMASLDRISSGRAGWNIVTGANPAEGCNFGLETQMPHEARHERAEEYVAVARALWDSIDDGALRIDKASGVYMDPARFHYLNHKGRYFSVRGPLNVPRPPQGHPVLVQAGASEAGLNLAARHAEVVFTAQQTMAGAQAFRADLHRRMAGFGRPAAAAKVLLGVVVVIGESAADARAQLAELQSLVPLDVALSRLSDKLGGVDLGPYALDGPLPEDLPQTNGSRSRRDLIIDMARREGLSIRDLALRLSAASGHWTIFGTPSEIADQMEEWFHAGAADGFMVLPPRLPESAEAFCDRVVPELQRRGLFRRDYAGRTLRDHLGLERPASTFASLP